jgi:predicted transcriptional regulator
MADDTYTAEQREALTAANLETGRVPLYYNCAAIHGRLPRVVIQGLIELGLVIKKSENHVELTDLGYEEAQRLLAAEEIPGF